MLRESVYCRERECHSVSQLYPTAMLQGHNLSHSLTFPKLPHWILAEAVIASKSTGFNPKSVGARPLSLFPAETLPKQS